LSDFIESFANRDSLVQVYWLLLQGLRVTILLAAASLPLAMLVGLGAALGYFAAGRWVRWGLLGLIDIFRAFPVIVLLILIYYGLPFASGCAAAGRASGCCTACHQCDGVD